MAILPQKAPSLKRQNLIQMTMIHAVLIFFSLIFVFPLLWMLITSIKPASEAMKTNFIPTEVRPGNYLEAIWYGSESLGYAPFIQYALNTAVVVTLIVAGTVISNAIVAYSFGRLNWPGRNVAFALTLATMMVPFPVLMVPIFGLFRDLGWVGTFKPLWVPAWFGSAFNIYLLTQFFKSLPFELSEAAKIDGCSEWKIFADIIVPLSKPALAVVGLFSFMGAMNDFLGPLIYLQDQKSYTLSLGLQAFQSQHGGTQWHLLMAASAIVIAPIIILFFFTQRLFIQGIAVTGIKG
ncbi:MAG: carbohydrate ABC transporter permease [Fimbriimonadaceae bacterium]|nr:carbohydrate ABC transporter permease [Fimbriimonadaceae bacterium]